MRRIWRYSAIFLFIIVTDVIISLSRVNPGETKQKSTERIRRCCAVFLIIIVTNVTIGLCTGRVGYAVSLVETKVILLLATTQKIELLRVIIIALC